MRSGVNQYKSLIIYVPRDMTYELEDLLQEVKALKSVAIQFNPSYRCGMPSSNLLKSITTRSMIFSQQ